MRSRVCGLILINLIVRVEGVWFRVSGSEFRVQGPGLRVSGSGFRVEGLGLTGRGGWLRSCSATCPPAYCCFGVY